MKLIVANWKQNFNRDEALEWVSEFSVDRVADAKAVICPQFPLISLLKDRSDLILGAQDVSKFEKGSYTGEVSAEVLSGLVEYAIVGHSERRRNFGESDKDVESKVKNCLRFGITPIICVSDISELNVTDGVEEDFVIAWETPEHISGGGKYNPDDPVHANEMCRQVKEVVGSQRIVLYGGSVNSENAKSFIVKDSIDGFLVGKASLYPRQFARICSM